MATPYYIPEDRVPLPPPNAEVFTTACDYCIVACGYKVYRWPVGKEGGQKANENAFKKNFPVGPLGRWVSPNQHNIVIANGKPHHVIVVPDESTEAVNLTGDNSIRGGCIAQKVYNPSKPTRDRLQRPMVRVADTLMPVTWDFALDICAEISKYVLKNHSENAWACKTYSYQFIENTYAITRFALKDINTPAFAWHDSPAPGEESAGVAFAGFMTFGAGYWDRANADVLFISGTDPFETKTILWNEWIMPAIQKKKMKVIMVLPRKTAGAAYAEANGGLFLDVYPGTDAILYNAIARVIVENNGQDMDFIKNWTSNFSAPQWETESGFGRGTRNTHWQWITTWGKLAAKGYDDWKAWLLGEKEFEINKASEITGVSVEKIKKAAELLGNADGKKKVSFAYEKGNYWSNNYLNTASLGSLALLTGCGNRPGRMMGRLGGHQRGGVGGGNYPDNKSPDKFGGRRRLTMDVDRWVESGHVRLAWVVGNTWLSAMAASQGFMDTFNKLTRGNPNQVTSLAKEEIIETLKKRVDSGGMVVVNQEIYLRDPIGAKYADIVLPAATWGEVDFTRANGERRLRLYSKFYDAPGEAKPDWWIVAKWAKKMGFEGYDWKDSNDVFEEAARFSRGRQDNNYDALVWMAKKKGVKAYELLKKFGTTGIQTPVVVVDEDYKYDRPGAEYTMPKAMKDSNDIKADGYKIIGIARLQDSEWKLPDFHFGARFVDPKILTAFNTQSGKANWLKSPWDVFSDFFDAIKPKDDELWVTNGRINEIWQSGFDDVERRPYITQRFPENFIEIHPDDAKARGIESGDMVLAYSERIPVWKDSNMGTNALDTKYSNLVKQGHIKMTKASVTAVAIVTPAVKKGVSYMYFLHPTQPANSLAPRVPDPLTNQYRYKLGVGKVKKIGESPYKNDFRAMTFARRDIV
ncbi:MAG TPA: arsenate reductase (azurin) large subunit [Deltaproteobacteria bacterium]|nr:arsenate reductase (azurin) large subunit [Deltaproteobacteria bacterium]